MTWMNAAFGFVFFSNAVFLLGAAYLLYRVLDVSEQTRADLLKVSQQSLEAATHLKVVARRALHDMERTHEGYSARENANSRQLNDLSAQMRMLHEQWQRQAQQPTPGLAPPTDHETTLEDIRARLHAELNAALSKNHQLQEEIDQTQFRLKDASFTNSELRHKLTEVKDLKQASINQLQQQANELETQLERARERAQAAEALAVRNASQLEDIREQFHAQQQLLQLQKNAEPPATGGPPEGWVDQTGLIQDQQEQIDLLATRERQHLQRIDQLEQLIQRTETEKGFLEDRFLQLDSALETGSFKRPPEDKPAPPTENS